MSLPGLDLSQASVEAQRAPLPPTQISLSTGSEWRFEVAFGHTVRVKVRLPVLQHLGPISVNY
jgi:polyribonucleotide 5'-hydroxyl-kinase